METDDRRSIHEIDAFGSHRKLTWIPREQNGFRNPNSRLDDPPIQKETPRFRTHKIQESPARAVPNNNVKFEDNPAAAVTVANSADLTAVADLAARKGESVRRVRTDAGESDKSRLSGNLFNSRRLRSVSPHPHEQCDSSPSQGDSGESDGQRDSSLRLVKPGRAAHHHAVHTITEDYEKEQMLQSEQSPVRFRDSSENMRDVASYMAKGKDRMSKARNLNVQDPRSKSFSAAHTRDHLVNSDLILRGERKPGPPSLLGSPLVAERPASPRKTQIETGSTPTVMIFPSSANRKLGLNVGSQVAPVPDKRQFLPTPPLPSEPQADKPDHPMASETRVALSPLDGNEELSLDHLTPSTNGRRNLENSSRFNDDEEGGRRRSFSGFARIEKGDGLSKRFHSKSRMAGGRGDETGATFPQDVGSMSQRATERSRSSPPGKRDTGTVKAPSKGGNDKDELSVERRQLDSHVRHAGAGARGRSQRIGEPGKSLLSEKSLSGGSKRYSRGSQSCRCQSIASPMFHPGEEDESLSHIKTIVLNSSSEAKKFQSLPSSVSAVSSDSSLPQSQDLSFNNNRDQFPFPSQVEKWKLQQPSDLHCPTREKMISDSQRLDEKYFLQTDQGTLLSASKAFDQDVYSKLVLGTGIQDHLGKSGRAASRSSSSVSQSCSMMTRRGAPRSASPAAQLRRWIINHFTPWSKVKIKDAGSSKSGTDNIVKSDRSKEEKPAPPISEEKVRKKSPWRRIIAGGKKKKNPPGTPAKAGAINFTPEYHQSMRFVSARFDNGTQLCPMSRIGIDPQTQCRMTPLYTEPNATPSRRWMFVDGNATATAAPHGHRLSNVEGVGYSIHAPGHRLSHMEGIGYSNRLNRRDAVGYSTPSRRMMMYAEPELQGDFYEPHLTAFSVADTPSRGVNGTSTPAHRLMYLDNDGYITPAHRFSHREAPVGFASPGPAFIESNGNATPGLGPAHRAMFVESNGNATPAHRAVFVDGNGNVTPAHRAMYVDTNGNATPTPNYRTTHAHIPGIPIPQAQAGSASRKAYLLPPIPSPSPAHFRAQRVS